MLFKKDISKELKKEAIKLGLCTEWTESWGNPTKDELIEKYIRGIDFCIEHDYPSCEYMKSNFEGIMQKHGVHVDDNINLVNTRTVVCNGSTNGLIKYNDYSLGTLYIRHHSDVIIQATDNSIVMVETYDDCNVSIFQSDNARVFVYDHGGNLQVSGKVIIKNRRAPI